jgi:hypothetical protein
VTHLEYDASVSSCLGRTLRFGNRERERLVTKDVFARHGRLDNEIGVRRMWGCDEHSLDIGVGQDFVIGRRRAAAVSLGKGVTGLC